MEKKTFKISGMHCAGCAQTVEKAIREVDSIHSVHVNLAAETAVVEVEEGQFSDPAIRNAVEKAGYSLPAETESTGKLAGKRARDREKLHEARQKLRISWIVTLPVMIWMMLEMVFHVRLADPLVMETAMTLAAAFVLFFPGRSTLESARRSAVSLRPNMDVLIAIGTATSLATGLLAIAGHLGFILFPVHSFAGIAAMIMAFHLTGRYIETKSRGRASDAIIKLLTLEAETARIIRGGREKEIRVSELKKGDIMVIRPGEKIPADGEVAGGEGSVNESMVTGESMPVRKETGAEVIGGTLNLEGSFRVKAQRVGEDTFLNRVVRLVEEAQGTRVPIQEYADRITAVFVPVVLVIALATFLAWVLFPAFFLPLTEWADGIIPWVEPGLGRWSQAFYASLAVLVIACPCALGLATPAALMIGSGLGAENGILIRRGEAIQRIQEATAIVFDKTGTLTLGKPSVTGLILLDHENREDLLNLVYAVEYHSEHPLGRAITDYASKPGTGPAVTEEFRSSPGMGVTAVVEGRKVIAGNHRLLTQEGVVVPEAVEQRKTELERRGQTVVTVAVAGSVSALITLADILKPEAAETVRTLKKQGFRTALLTGDNKRVAESIAGDLEIDLVFAEVLPDQKEDVIRRLQREGEVVAMVGDGTNDAPALARADVGIAIGTGTDIAIESASVILIDGNLTTLLKAVELGRRTFAKIRQNLFWSYFYNVVMIPVAIAGLMHPVLAEAAMAFSSVTVIGNSRRLQKKGFTDCG